PEQADELAVRDRAGDVADRFEPVEDLADVGDLQHGRRADVAAGSQVRGGVQGSSHAHIPPGGPSASRRAFLARQCRMARSSTPGLELCSFYLPIVRTTLAARESTCKLV